MSAPVDPFIEKLSALKQTDPLSAEETSTYAEVLEILRARKMGGIILRRGEQITGIFTERDVVNKCLLEDIDPDTPVRELMTRSPVTLGTGATVGEAIALMHQRHIRNLPLVDEKGQLVGLLTVGRLIRYLASAFPAEVMNLPPKPSQVTEDVEGA